MQLGIRIRKECRVSEFKMAHVIIVLATLSLIINELHTVYGNLYYFYFETFFFNLYYLSLVFYGSRRLVVGVYPGERKPLNIITGAYVAFIVIYIGLLVAGILVEQRQCERNFP